MRMGGREMMDEILSALKHRGDNAVVASAREFLGSNELANGDKLNALRTYIGRYRFGEFMARALPQLGVSRTTGYRWAKLASHLPRHFKNRLIRKQLMRLGSGRGILTIRGSGQVCLTPAVRTALRQLPPQPRNQNEQSAKRWTAQLLVTTAKVRARARARLAKTN